MVIEYLANQYVHGKCKHLRATGKELCYNYFLFNLCRNETKNSPQQVFHVLIILCPLYLCKKLCFTVSDVLFILQLYFKDKDKRPLPFISSSGLVPELRVECEEERADIS